VINWELFTNGKNPCPSALTHVALANKVINEAWRPSLPHTCPVQWKSFIESCWNQSSSNRPTFKSIIGTLRDWVDNPPQICTDYVTGDSSDCDNSIDGQNSEEESFPSETNSQTLIQSNKSYDDAIS